MPRSMRTRASNCILLTVVVICVCNLVVFGVIIVREYAMASGFDGASCLVDDVRTESTRTCRFCGNAKDSKKKQTCQMAEFPCLKVMVSYRVGEERHTGQLHSDSLQATGEHSQCSFTVCKKHLYENKKEVQKYADIWLAKKNANQQFQCFYNTEAKHVLIAEKMHTKSEVIHSMLWPSLIILLCGFIFFHLEMRRRGVAPCGANQQANIITCPYSRGVTTKGSGYPCGNGKPITVQLQTSPEQAPLYQSPNFDGKSSSPSRPSQGPHSHNISKTRYNDKTISRSTPTLVEMLIMAKTPPGSSTNLCTKTLYSSASVDHIHNRHSISSPRALLHPKSAAHARDIYQNRTRSLDVDDKGSGQSLKARETPV